MQALTSLCTHQRAPPACTLTCVSWPSLRGADTSSCSQLPGWKQLLLLLLLLGASKNGPASPAVPTRVNATEHTPERRRTARRAQQPGATGACHHSGHAVQQAGLTCARQVCCCEHCHCEHLLLPLSLSLQLLPHGVQRRRRVQHHMRLLLLLLLLGCWRRDRQLCVAREQPALASPCAGDLHVLAVP